MWDASTGFAVPRSCPGKATVVIGEASTSTLLPAPCAGLISLPAPTDRTCGIAKGSPSFVHNQRPNLIIDDTMLHHVFDELNDG